jgi:LuxR family maltose regulon positive regulatory protein
MAQLLEPNLPDGELRFRYESRLIDLCRTWMALGRNDAAAGLLETLAEAARERNGSRITILTLLAAARSREAAPAMAALEEALRLAEPEGYLRAFLDVGEPLRQVLVLWLKNQRSNIDLRLYEYTQQVLSSFDVTWMPSRTTAAQPVGLPEPLSEREQEVLLLVAEGLTNQQIADRLVISVRTVKKHVENIHGKLGVQNRTQAANRARELGLH